VANKYDDDEDGDDFLSLVYMYVSSFLSDCLGFVLLLVVIVFS